MSWLSSVRAVILGSRSASRTLPTRKVRSCRLALELLEDRRTPALVVGGFEPGSMFVRPTGETDVVVEGPNNTLMYNYTTASGAWASTQIAGANTTFTTPSITVRSNGEADVVAEGPNNTLMYYWATPGSGWSSTQIAGAGTTFTRADVFVRSTGEADVVAEGANNSLMYYYASPGTAWSSTQIAGANTTFAPPSIYVRSTGEADVVAEGANNSLMYYYAWPGTAWSSTQINGAGTTYTRPDVFVRANGEADVVAQGPNNSLNYYWATPGSAWSKTKIAGANTTFSAPSVYVRSTGEADVVAEGANNSLMYYYAWSGTAWSSTQIAGAGTTDSAAAVAVQSTGLADVVACGPGGSLMVYTATPGSAWSSTQIVWSEPGSGQAYSPVSGVLFAGSPTYTDVQQGQEGDCWLLSSLGETALRAPTDITNMFTYGGTVTENGVNVALYTVRFYNSSGTANYVLVDATLPNGGSEYDQPVNGVLWVALAEKAYAEANGAGLVTSGNIGTNTYDALGGGDPSWALQAITGKSAPDSSVNPTTLPTAWQNGSLLVLCTPALPANATSLPVLNGVNVVPWHAYSVVGYNASTQVFTLANPWGVNGGYDQLPNGTLVFCAGTVTGTANQLANFYTSLTQGSGSSGVGGDKPALPAGLVLAQGVGLGQGAARVQPQPLVSRAAMPSTPSDAVYSAAGAQGPGESPMNLGLQQLAEIFSEQAGLSAPTVAEFVWDKQQRGSIADILFADLTPVSRTRRDESAG